MNQPGDVSKEFNFAADPHSKKVDSPYLENDNEPGPQNTPSPTGPGIGDSGQSTIQPAPAIDVVAHVEELQKSLTRNFNSAAKSRESNDPSIGR